MTNIWKSPETAPKDRLFLADVGWPWPTLCHWCPCTESWATAVFQAAATHPDGGIYDVWFGTEQERAGDLRGWMDLPQQPDDAPVAMGAAA